MPAFIAADVSAALVALLNDHPSLADVQIEDGYPGDDIAEPERMWTGKARSDELTPAGLKAGRTFYQEAAEFDLVIQVIKPGGDVREVKARVQELGRFAAEVVADNRTLGNVPGLNFAVARRWETNFFHLGNSTYGELIYTIGYQARLT